MTVKLYKHDQERILTRYDAIIIRIGFFGQRFGRPVVDAFGIRSNQYIHAEQEIVDRQDLIMTQHRCLAKWSVKCVWNQKNVVQTCLKVKC